MGNRRRQFLIQTLGPGLLLAGTAVGVSHLVQSTRAGAEYGFGLLLVILAANLFKYPAFSFGPHYAAATGTSLLEGYRRQGRWALGLYALLTVGTMFTVMAAVTVVTAGLAKALLRWDVDVVVISVLLMVLCALALQVGRYRWLDGIMKVVVALLTVQTLVATILVLPSIDWSELRLWPAPDQWNARTAIFVAPLVGWMPSAVDVAVWHSLWTLAKRRDTAHAPSVKDAALDFQIGYIGAACLALCFMLLGVGVLFRSDVPLAQNPGGFANQVIELYTATLGEWSRYLIGPCAFAVMFSTTMTVVDGFPRALAALYERFRSAEQPGVAAEDSRLVYRISMMVLIVGAAVILQNMARLKFTLLLDIATALSFLTTPVLAVLNHRVMTGPEVPVELRPSRAKLRFSALCCVVLVGFALWWAYVRFGL